jgi:dipeptidase E
MRLLLCSYRLGGHADVLRDLCTGRRAAVVPNATDQWPESPHHRDRETSDLAAAGFDVSIVDLRDYFGKDGELAEVLDGIDVVWVPGGNTFVLARAMHASGFRHAAAERVRSGSLAYAGYSAGACVAGPDLIGIHVMDEPDAVPVGYDASWPATTLGFVPWRIVPHWSSDHPESPAADAAVTYLLQAQLPFQTLQDGKAVVVDGDTMRVA